MARTSTPKNQKLKQDAIRLRQELGLNNCEIAARLNHNESTIRYWLRNNCEAGIRNNSPLKFNTVHVMDCVDGMAKLPHESIDLVFTDPPYQVANNDISRPGRTDFKRNYEK